MGYRVFADVTMVVHFLFLAFVVTGGFLSWQWPRVIWAHLASAGWGLATVVAGLECPLTYVEDWARRMAGEAGLPAAGFIDHYIEGVIYPQEYAPYLQTLAALAITVSWARILVRLRPHGSAHNNLHSASHQS